MGSQNCILLPEGTFLAWQIIRLMHAHWASQNGWHWSMLLIIARSALWWQTVSSRQCSAQGTPEGVEDNGSLTRVAAFPIGIDPERFARALEKPNVKAHIAQLLNRYAGRKVQSAVVGMLVFTFEQGWSVG